MMTDETRADADRAKEAFQKRLSAATSVGQVAEVDWSYFKKGELMGYIVRVGFEKQSVGH